MLFLSSAAFFKINLPEKSFRTTVRVSNGLNQDQGPILANRSS